MHHAHNFVSLTKTCIALISVSQDAHNCIPDFDEDTAMFAVYDGHGGETLFLSAPYNGQLGCCLFC